MATAKVEKEKFPQGISYILWNIFFDRFSSGGFIVILAIYINQKLQFDTNTATAIYHINEFILYFSTICGAIIADSKWGMYKTLTRMSIICALSTTIVAIAALELPFVPLRIASFLGIIAAMIGTGCIKSNQNVFGGNQFKLPEQSSLLNYYFSMHYLVLKSGQVGGMILIPIIREDVKCFGRNDCYSLAFGIPSIAMAIALAILWIGNKKFIHVPTSGNILIDVIGCIKNAIIKKMTSPRSSPRLEHWLDYSEEKFGPKLVKDTKSVLSILVLYLPLPVFWALLSQQSSRWVFQATRMDGNIGWYTIKPDQMNVLGPLCIAILIPIFNQIIFPLLAKIKIKSPLQKMSCGMICAGFSFIMSAYVETQINQRSISIVWLFPQYFLVAISEILLWVAYVAFAYTETPMSMKSVMTALVYLTVAGGSLIVFLISGLKIFDSQVYEFLFYACLMFVDTIAFVILAMRYRYVELDAGTVANQDSDHA